MVKPTEPTQGVPTGEAVDEAIRALTEASNASSISARQTLANTRSLLSDVFALNRQAIQAVTGGIEATLKAGFQFQSALLAAAPPLLDSTFESSKTVVKAWTGVAQQEQTIALKAVHRASELLDNVTPPRAS